MDKEFGCCKCHRPLNEIGRNFKIGPEGLICSHCQEFEEAENFKKLIHTIRVETLKEIDTRAQFKIKEKGLSMYYRDALCEVFLEMFKEEGIEI